MGDTTITNQDKIFKTYNRGMTTMHYIQSMNQQGKNADKENKQKI